MSDHTIVPGKYYVAVFLALGVLTIVTVYTAKYVDLGNFNFVLAMFIASIKAILVITIFMGLYWEKNPFTLVVLSFSFVVFALFISLTILDLYTRQDLNEAENFYNKVDNVTSLSLKEEGLLVKEEGKNFVPAQQVLELQEKIQRDGLQSVLEEAKKLKE